MMFNRLYKHYLKEDNDFMDGLNEYEFLNKPIYYTKYKAFRRSNMKSVKHFLERIKMTHGKEKAEEAKRSLFTTGEYEHINLLYSLDPSKSKQIKESNEFMAGIEEYEFMHKPIYYWSKPRNCWRLSASNTIKRRYELIKFFYDEITANEFLNAMRMKKVWSSDYFDYYSIDPTLSNPVKEGRV